MKMYKYFLIIALLLSMSLSSCKKGCNNPRAYNYSTSAQQDDGTCLYCDSSKSTAAVNSINVYDYNSSSSYYGSNVLSGRIMADTKNYTGNGCKMLGKGVNSDGTTCISADYYLVLTNNTSKTVTYTDNMHYVYGNSQQQYTKLVNVNMAPYSSTTIAITTVCDSYVYMYLQSNAPTLQYH